MMTEAEAKRIQDIREKVELRQGSCSPAGDTMDNVSWTRDVLRKIRSGCSDEDILKSELGRGYVGYEKRMQIVVN